jgi:CRP-like cAMP-binding protein
MKSLVAAGIPRATITEISRRMWLNTARRRQILYAEGNRATHLYAVRSGRVKLVKLDAGGREHIVAVHEPGELFGFEAVFDHAYSTGAEALTDCELCLASGPELGALMREMPSVAVDLAGYLHHQLCSTRNRQVYLGASAASAKLAGFLLDGLSGDAGSPGAEATLSLDLTLKELGGILGLSPETVCRLLGTLKTRGIIESHPAGIRVRDLDSLRRLAGA